MEGVLPWLIAHASTSSLSCSLDSSTDRFLQGVDRCEVLKNIAIPPSSAVSSDVRSRSLADTFLGALDFATCKTTNGPVSEAACLGQSCHLLVTLQH